LISPGSPSGPDSPLVSDVGERGLIDRIRRRLPPPPSDVIVGIGDDAAVAVPERGALQVFTTDALVEGIHFDRRFSSIADIGYKALAVNVSDVAAMGGVTRLALLSLVLPEQTTVVDVDRLLDGLLEMAGSARVALVGGNITRSPGPLMIDVTAIGSVRRRKILTRGGGRAGDVLYLTGTIGESSFRGPSGALRMVDARVMVGTAAFSGEFGFALRARAGSFAKPRDELVRVGARSSIWLGPSGLSLSLSGAAPKNTAP